MHPAVDVRVLRRGLQVLPDGHDVDAVRAQVAHRVDHLVVRLAEPDDDPRLRHHVVRGELLHALEEPQRLLVARLRAAHPRVQSADGLDVVAEHVRASVEHRDERLLLDAEEVGREDLDGRARQLPLERADRRRVVAGAAVGQVVAVDRGDDDVRETHPVRGLGEAKRLERVRRGVRLARVHVAVAACARADVAQDLERGRPAPPALADVRAAGLLADRDEPALAHEPLDLVVARVDARRPHLHPLGAPRPLGDRQGLLHRGEV